jgi:hypothetical protein
VALVRPTTDSKSFSGKRRVDDFVAARVAEWQPKEAFVIDVCDTGDRLKVLELNTLNAAGFYAGDVQKLVLALHEAFG